jgi:peptidyl-prolyl cis-trans isomerase SurA
MSLFESVRQRRRLAWLWLAAAALSTACRSTATPPAPSADTWATVGGKAITGADVEKVFRRDGTAQALSEEEALTAKLNILDNLIMEEVLLGKAAASKVTVPDNEVETAYSQAKANLTEEAFQQELTKRNLTAADMKEGLRRQLLTNKLMSQEVTSKVIVTDQQVTDFFNANRAQFNLTEDAFHLAQIIVTPARDEQLANRTGDDATTPQAAANKIQQLMQRLQGGGSFAELARDFSEDPESAPRGGDLGLVPLSAVKQAAPALRDAVLQMTPGNARIISQGGAYSIVLLVAKEAAGQRDLSMPQVKQQITEGLKARREQLLRTAYIAAARTDAEVVNYEARRIVESQSAPAATAAPSAAPTAPGAPK